MTWVAAPATPWWFVAVIVLVGAGVGRVLTPRLASVGYRLDDETGSLPFPPWGVMPVTALAWGVLAWRLGALGDYTVLPALLTFTTVAVALVWIDADVHRLPTGLVRPAIVLVAAQLAFSSAVTGDWAALLRAGVCAVVLLLVFLVLALLAGALGGAFGLGDVQLAALLGLTTGYLSAWAPLVTTYAAFLLGGAWALGRIVLRRADRRSAIAFGPWMLLGGYLSLLVEVRPFP
ncbi:MAG: prepilin peptidase [Humibacillus sp.]|nr:prepilin peptidase [Humibacillus sp.]MDN5776475.1 prepilin peptidase [Humibacillus sp.]